MKRNVMVAAIAFGFVLGASGAAYSQSLNQRESAPPGVNAKIGRALTKSRSQEAENGHGINRDTVNAGCGPVQLGNDTKSNSKRTKHDEQTVIVPNVTVICR